MKVKVVDKNTSTCCRPAIYSSRGTGRLVFATQTSSDPALSGIGTKDTASEPSSTLNPSATLSKLTEDTLILMRTKDNQV